METTIVYRDYIGVILGLLYRGYYSSGVSCLYQDELQEYCIMSVMFRKARLEARAPRTIRGTQKRPCEFRTHFQRSWEDITCFLHGRITLPLEISA